MKRQDEMMLMELLDENFHLEQVVDSHRFYFHKLQAELDDDAEVLKLCALGLLVAGVLLMCYGFGV